MKTPQSSLGICLAIERYLSTKQDGFKFTVRELMDSIGATMRHRRTVYRHLNKLVRNGRLIKQMQGYEVVLRPKLISISDCLNRRLRFVHLPFSLHNRFAFYPGDIISFCAVTGYKKTVLAVNFAKHLVEKEIPVDYYCTERYYDLAERLHSLIPEGKLNDESYFRLLGVTSLCKLEKSSRGRVIIYDWLDFGGRYHLAPVRLRELSRQHNNLIIVFMQAKVKTDSRGFSVYGQEGAYHPVSLAIRICYDEEDKKHRFPILHIEKAATPLRNYYAGSEIFLRQVEDSLELQEIDCYSREDLRKYYINAEYV